MNLCALNSKKRHVVNIICQLIECYITDCQFLSTITFFYGCALNIPNAYNRLIFFNLNFALFINAF